MAMAAKHNADVETEEFTFSQCGAVPVDKLPDGSVVYEFPDGTLYRVPQGVKPAITKLKMKRKDNKDGSKEERSEEGTSEEGTSEEGVSETKEGRGSSDEEQGGNT